MSTKKPKLTNAEVHRLYVERGWSYRKIADYFERGKSTIFDRHLRFLKEQKEQKKKGVVR